VVGEDTVINTVKSVGWTLADNRATDAAPSVRGGFYHQLVGNKEDILYRDWEQSIFGIIWNDKLFIVFTH
jgi:hypothetical protein